MNKKFFWVFFVSIIVFSLSIVFILPYINEQKEKIISSDKNYKVYDISEDDKPRYRYKIYNSIGKVAKDEIVERIEPRIEYLLDNSLLSINISAGTGLYYTQYYDISKNLFSEVFESPLIAEYSKIVYIDFLDNEFRLVVRDIFDKSKYYKEFMLDFSPVANLTDAWNYVEFLDSNTLKITYFSGSKYNEKTVILSLDLF